MFDMKRPIRTVALEPNFAKKGTRAFVCGGLAGALVLREKGWLGHKETTLHTGEGPIWHVRWRTHLIAWANDLVSGFMPNPSLLLPYISIGCQDIRHTITDSHHLHRQRSR